MKGSTICVYINTNRVKEALMVEVTAEASKQVTEFFKGRDIKPIRIFMNDGG